MMIEGVNNGKGQTAAGFNRRQLAPIPVPVQVISGGPSFTCQEVEVSNILT